MKYFAPSLLAGWLLWAGTEARAQAIIEGTVALPEPKPAKAASARYQGQPKISVAPEPPAAVVYLEGDFPPASNVLAVLAQKDFKFATSLLPIQRGTRVEFPNEDSGYHNVFSYSKPKRFDLGRYRSDEKPPSQVFDEAGVVKLYCEIHEHMRSTILVLDTPHFVKTEADGRFRLEKLPAGKYTVKAWIDEKTVFEQAVELEPGKTLRVDFSKK